MQGNFYVGDSAIEKGRFIHRRPEKIVPLLAALKRYCGNYDLCFFGGLVARTNTFFSIPTVKPLFNLRGSPPNKSFTENVKS